MNCIITKLKWIHLLGVVIALTLCKQVAADENDFRCLTSVGLKNPVRLQFTFRTDKDAFGYINYQRGSGRIEVRQTKERELRQGPGGRPSELELTWEEITPGGSTGSYVMVVQGARIYDFRYIRKKDGKMIKFVEDIEASTEKGCVWK